MLPTKPNSPSSTRRSSAANSHASRKRGAAKRSTPTNASVRQAPGVMYYNIASLLRSKIEEGKWIAGERMPSILALATEFGVSIVTIRLALDLLESERIVERLQGSGTYVSRDFKRKQWVTLASDWGELTRMWGNRKPQPPIAAYDTVGVPSFSPEDGVLAPSYRYMKRLHVLDGTPYAIVDIYVDRRLYVLHPNRFDVEMAIGVLDSLEEANIESMSQRVTISTADLETAHRLKIPVCAPVGVIRRVIRDKARTVIYVATAVYPGNLVKLEHEVSRFDR